MFFISNQANQVTKSDIHILPHSAACSAIGKVINLEYPKLKCRCIDIDIETPVDRLLEEIYSQKKNYLVAYRNNNRYVEELEKVDIDRISNRKIEFKQDGCYIITGGTGWLGLETAKYLASRTAEHAGEIERGGVVLAAEHVAEIVAGDVVLSTEQAGVLCFDA